MTTDVSKEFPTSPPFMKRKIIGTVEEYETFHMSKIMQEAKIIRKL